MRRPTIDRSPEKPEMSLDVTELAQVHLLSPYFAVFFISWLAEDAFVDVEEQDPAYEVADTD